MIYLAVDNPTHREELRSTLAGLGYDNEVFDCGDDIVRRLKFRNCDLAILDCGGNSSFDLLTKIRAYPFGRTLPVVMFGQPNAALKQKALHEGADAFVAKGSMDWADLLTEIQRYVGQPRVGRSSTTPSSGTGLQRSTD